MRRFLGIPVVALLALPLVGEAQSTGLPPALPLRDDLPIERPAPAPREHGYPVLDVDRDQILALFRNGRVAELEALLDDYRDRVRGDIRWEDHLIAAYDAFFGSEKDIGPLFDPWVSASSRSAAPHLARSHYLLARAWEARGEGWASDVGEESWRAVDRFRQRARQDAERALELEPENLAAYSTLLRVLLLQGWSSTQERVLASGLEAFPTSYAIRIEALGGMKPRWGGSYRRMRRLAEEAQGHARENPRLRVLLGAVPLEEGWTLYYRDRYPDALRKYDEAGRFGADWAVHAARGRSWYYAGDYVRALEELNRAAVQRPSSPSVLEWRGRTLARIAETLAPPDSRVRVLTAAEVDLDIAVRINQPDANLAQWLAWTTYKRQLCAASPATCFDAAPAATPPPSSMTADPPGLWRKLLLFLISLPTTLHDILSQANELGLGPAPWLGSIVILWSFFDWRRQRYWTPGFIHGAAVLAFVTIAAINLVWVGAGGGMWVQRYVMIVLFTSVPYLVYLLCMGPRFVGARRLRAVEED